MYLSSQKKNVFWPGFNVQRISTDKYICKSKKTLLPTTPGDRTLSKRKATQRNNQNNQVINFDQAKDSYNLKRAAKVDLIPRNSAQDLYVAELLNVDNKIVIATGPAGTGKTLLAVLRAVQALKNGEIKRIVVTRPAVSVDEQHGFLPGDLQAKMAPWTRPIFDILEEYWSPTEINAMIEDRVIEISPLAYMRGRTFKNCYIIADEMQNATIEQMKMLLTRPGSGTWMAVTGDPEQHDRGFDKNGLLDFTSRIDGWDVHGIASCSFTRQHVERDPIVEAVLTIYGEE